MHFNALEKQKIKIFDQKNKNRAVCSKTINLDKFHKYAHTRVYNYMKILSTHFWTHYKFWKMYTYFCVLWSKLWRTHQLCCNKLCKLETDCSYLMSLFSFRTFSAADEKVEIPINMGVKGDVRIVVYHARNFIGMGIGRTYIICPRSTNFKA